MNMMNMNKSKKVYSNILQQDCYIRDCRVAYDLASCNNPASLESKYMSVDEIVVDNGVEVKTSLHDYPITPDSVNSYLDSVDYKSDLTKSVNSPPPGVNLGDVSAIQEFNSMSDSAKFSLYKELFARFSKLSDASPISGDPNNNDNNNGGVE